MKYLIASDLHGSAHCCRALLEAFEREQADRIILLHNCPTSVHKEYVVDLPRPRDYTSPDFLALREQITAEMDNTL